MAGPAGSGPAAQRDPRESLCTLPTPYSVRGMAAGGSSWLGSHGQIPRGLPGPLGMPALRRLGLEGFGLPLNFECPGPRPPFYQNWVL